MLISRWGVTATGSGGGGGATAAGGGGGVTAAGGGGGATNDRQVIIYRQLSLFLFRAASEILFVGDVTMTSPVDRSLLLHLHLQQLLPHLLLRLLPHLPPRFL